MNDTYVECLVKAKQSGVAIFFKVLLVLVAVVLVIATFILGPFGFFALLLALICCVGVYFVNLLTDLEYEYLYLDRELVVDKIMAKSRRKRVATYGIDKIIIMAPMKSYRLDNYKNRSTKVKDYSVGAELTPDLRYVMHCEGGEEIWLSPSEELVKALRSVAPHKVFAD